MNLQARKEQIKDAIDNCINSWAFTAMLCLTTAILFIAIAMDLVAIMVTGRSMWYPYPK